MRIWICMWDNIRLNSKKAMWGAIMKKWSGWLWLDWVLWERKIKKT